MHDESKSVFVEALAIPVAERAAFLLEACRGDDSLREEVESLLHHHDQLSLTQPKSADERGGLRSTLHSVVRSWVRRGEEVPDASAPPEARKGAEHTPLD